MEKKRKMPKVVMAASVAVMGMGLFSTLGNEARATGGGGGNVCYNTITTLDGSQVRYCGTCDWVMNSKKAPFSGSSEC